MDRLGRPGWCVVGDDEYWVGKLEYQKIPPIYYKIFYFFRQSERYFLYITYWNGCVYAYNF